MCRLVAPHVAYGRHGLRIIRVELKSIPMLRSRRVPIDSRQIVRWRRKATSEFVRRNLTDLLDFLLERRGETEIVRRFRGFSSAQTCRLAARTGRGPPNQGNAQTCQGDADGFLAHGPTPAKGSVRREGFYCNDEFRRDHD